MALKDEIGGVSWIGTKQFCDQLHRATLHGNREEQGEEGEALWELYEALEERFPPPSRIVEIPRRTVDAVMAAIEDLLRHGGIPRDAHEDGLAALRKRLTANGVPTEIAE